MRGTSSKSAPQRPGGTQNHFPKPPPVRPPPKPPRRGEKKTDMVVLTERGEKKKEVQPVPTERSEKKKDHDSYKVTIKEAVVKDIMKAMPSADQKKTKVDNRKKDDKLNQKAKRKPKKGPLYLILANDRLEHARKQVQLQEGKKCVQAVDPRHQGRH